MGTYYTFITEPLHQTSDKIEQIDKLLQEEKQANPDHFDYSRQEFKSFVWFSGYSKNMGEGFLDWPAIDISVRVVWLDNEGGHGGWWVEDDSQRMWKDADD